MHLVITGDSKGNRVTSLNGVKQKDSVSDLIMQVRKHYRER